MHKIFSDRAKLFYLVSLMALLLCLGAVGPYSAVSARSLLIEIACAASYILYSYAYFYRKVLLKAHLFDGLPFMAMVVFFLALSLFYPGYMSYAIIGNFEYYVYLIAEVSLFYAPLFALAYFSAHLFFNNKRYFGLALLAIVAVLLLYYIYFIRYPLDYAPNDEIFLSFLSSRSLLSGSNPYTANYTGIILGNAGAFGATYTTLNGVVGKLGYPAAYLLVTVPFYLMTKFTAPNLINVDVKAEAIVFIFALIVVIFYSDRSSVKRAMPDWYVIAFMCMSLIFALSMVEFLMLAVILLAYLKYDRWYNFLLFGLAISLQEELWLPVLLLLVYLLNTRGYREAARALVGAIAVFVVINSYFLILSPGALLHDIISPISGYIIPNSFTPIGYAILAYAHVLLGSFVVTGIIVALLLLVIFKFFGKKELIPLFSFVFMLFLYRGQWAYYTFFGLMFVAAIGYSRDNGASKALHRAFGSAGINAVVAYASLALLLALFVINLYISHLAYASAYGIRVENQSLVINAGVTYYNATMSYTNVSHKLLTVSILATFNNSTGYYGLFGRKLLVEPYPQSCNAYSCTFNPNIFMINGSGTSPLEIKIDGIEESQMAIMLYNDSYFYTAKGIYPVYRVSG
ncbi:MAG: hypothetical protein M1279_01145 [Candidatus Marsarchaeota archaeon]|nr:hypothetical protein [Candidatus Marsarchaeota archaeon]